MEIVASEQSRDLSHAEEALKIRSNFPFAAERTIIYINIPARLPSEVLVSFA